MTTEAQYSAVFQYFFENSFNNFSFTQLKFKHYMFLFDNYIHETTFEPLFFNNNCT